MQGAHRGHTHTHTRRVLVPRVNPKNMPSHTCPHGAAVVTNDPCFSPLVSSPPPPSMLKRYKTAMEAAYETGEGTATAAEQGEADTSAEVLTPYTSAAQAQESASIFIQQYSDRVAAGITSSTLDFTACVATVLDAASRARRDFTLAARRLCSHRGMWMDKHIEELDAVEKALKAHARLFRVIHVSDVLSAVLATSRALTDTDTLPQSSRMIDVCVGGRDTVMSTLLACNRVESFTSPVCVSLSGSGVEWCKPGSESHCLDHNTIHLSYVDSSGDPIRGVVPSDVTVWFSCPEGVTCCEVVSLLPTSSSTFELKYRVEAAEKRPYVMYVGMHLSLLHNSVGIASPSVFDIVVQPPRRPFRPKSAYLFYAESARGALKAELPEYTFPELAKELGRRWMEMGPSGKAVYEGQAIADKERYARDVAVAKLCGVEDLA